jgi:hypothetical protein
MVWTWHPLSDLPQVYDVIWCRFPHRPRLHLPADPPHPVVVREIEPGPPGSGEAIVHVTYGTSTLKPLRAALDLILSTTAEYSAVGLREPTRFDLQDDMNKLPCFWCTEFFPSRYPIGRLNATMIRKLENRIRWRATGAAIVGSTR